MSYEFLKCLHLSMIFLIFGFCLFQSCSNLSLRLPVARLESPESNGKLWRPGFGAAIGGNHEVTVISNAASRPPVTDQSSIEKDSQTSYFLNLGAASFVDIEFKLSLFCSELLAKFQLLGQSASEAKTGNFSIAATIAAGSGAVSKSGDQAVLFGPANAPWNAKANFSSMDLAIIFGYRASDTLLFFGGPFFIKYNSSASIHQDAVSSPASSAADYNITQSGTNNGANLAVQFHFSSERHWHLTLEEVYSSLNWSNSASANDFIGTLYLGYLF